VAPRREMRDEENDGKRERERKKVELWSVKISDMWLIPLLPLRL